jgi:TPR repeat protein
MAWANLAMCYIVGKGAPRDLAKAEELLERAIEAGLHQAEEKLTGVRKMRNVEAALAELNAKAARLLSKP